MTPDPQPVTPAELATLLAPALPTGLLGFDVDGVLAPIVEHADLAQLSPGVHDSLDALGHRATVAIISGRSLSDLEQRFAFPTHLDVVGSHGLESRDLTDTVLDRSEQARLEQLTVLGTKAVEAAGAGAWLELKPASVVVHTRSADPHLAARAVSAVSRLASMVLGASTKPGHHVVEMLARPASKGIALSSLAERRHCAPIVFLGDDVTDEDAFRQMKPPDISVRVGPGTTDARFRLGGPAEVAELLVRLTRSP